MTKSVSRWGAFAVHLLISLLVFTVLAALVLFWLFPGSLFLSAGGWEGLRIIAAVDLVLGPCLTLIVFNPRKPRAELVRDLSLIGLVQVLALAGGCYVVAQARPLAVVHVFDTFYVLNREDYRQAGLDPRVVDELAGWTPRFFYLEVPVNKADFLVQHTQALLNGETPLQQRVEQYRELPADLQALKQVLRVGDQTAGGSCLRVDLESSYQTGSVCFDLEARKVTDFIPAT
ncbi:hypothetical protein [Pseudomonas oryzae]|uniref:Type IV pilin accessory protein n=1 Tax=Pseudomonas oryzae TaxID=1392877 RepID=A0A1H1Y8I0_9PSED|nr:hypothetical protein [Pseudomonas oryzae]SDT17559.1 hypothetical protein SAMN05216221_3694 [Pseudomonas oryzae]